MKLPNEKNANRPITILTAIILLASQHLMASESIAQTQAPVQPTPGAKQGTSPLRSVVDWGKSLVTQAGHEKPALNLTPSSIAPRPAAKPTQPMTGPVAGRVSPISHLAAPRSSIIELGPTDNLAEIVARTRGPVVIDFHASWCGPCKKQAKLLKELDPYATQNGAAIVKIDVDKHATLAKKLNISSLPTLMVIKNGALVETKIGSVERQKIVGYLTREPK